MTGVSTPRVDSDLRAQHVHELSTRLVESVARLGELSAAADFPSVRLVMEAFHAASRAYAEGTLDRSGLEAAAEAVRAAWCTQRGVPPATSLVSEPRGCGAGGRSDLRHGRAE